MAEIPLSFSRGGRAGWVGSFPGREFCLHSSHLLLLSSKESGAPGSRIITGGRGAGGGLQAVTGLAEFCLFKLLECCQVGLFSGVNWGAAGFEVGLCAECHQATALFLVPTTTTVTTVTTVTSMTSVTAGRVRRLHGRVRRLTGCLFRSVVSSRRVARFQAGVQGCHRGGAQFRATGLGCGLGGFHQLADGASPAVTRVRRVVGARALRVGSVGSPRRMRGSRKRSGRAMAGNAAEKGRCCSRAVRGRLRRLEALELGLCIGFCGRQALFLASGVSRRADSGGSQARLGTGLRGLPLGGIFRLMNSGRLQLGHAGGQILRKLKVTSVMRTWAALAENQNQANQRQNQQTQHISFE